MWAHGTEQTLEIWSFKDTSAKSRGLRGALTSVSLRALEAKMRRKETSLEGWVRKPPTGVNLHYTVAQSLNALPCKHLDLSFDHKNLSGYPALSRGQTICSLSILLPAQTRDAAPHLLARKHARYNCMFTISELRRWGQLAPWSSMANQATRSQPSKRSS